MSLSSPEFFIFLLPLLLLWIVVCRWVPVKSSFLLFAGFLFYLTWGWNYAVLLAVLILTNYFAGLGLVLELDKKTRKTLLIGIVIFDLGLLAFCKYSPLLSDLAGSIGPVFGSTWLSSRSPFLLTVGISFITFKVLSHAIDVYRNPARGEKNLINFGAYVSFFPELLSGPIERSSSFLPQLHRVRLVSRSELNRGLLLVFRGLFKKIVIADLLAGLGVDTIFANPDAFSSWDLLMALYGYSFQIYNDFSGYTDIAMGVSQMLGFSIPENFRKPYLSANIREFWSRWHISLSTWLRDYLYIPLGGNRGTRSRVSFNLMATMLLGGLWHGAGINFILWGAYHGFLLVLAHTFRKSVPAAIPVPRVAKQLVCFHLVTFGWLLFRVSSMEQFLHYFRGFASWSWSTQFHGLFYVVLAVGIFSHLCPEGTAKKLGDWFVLRPAFVQAAAYSLMVLMLCGLTIGSPSFIYFQF